MGFASYVTRFLRWRHDLVLRTNDLELLDPWVIDGRYAADLPDVGISEASDLLDAADEGRHERATPCARLTLGPTDCSIG